MDAPEESPGILTSREREVADLMCAGLPNEQIGERLVISPATVKSHIRAILRKLGAANRSHAIAIHLRHTHNPA
ncbi:MULTISPECIES: response regulator transcription factor [Protofrankia]|uniref:response regulator transcription factor n=1 Tax=Protofrankia TaxID=2994361 RepID=UPI0001C5353A|nr:MULTISPECIES: helix-turn-helix transcriptional regulator [Protofrankia]